MARDHHRPLRFGNLPTPAAGALDVRPEMHDRIDDAAEDHVRATQRPTTDPSRRPTTAPERR